MADYTQYINSAAGQFGIQPSILGALINQESGGNPYATNPNSSAVGLGQLTTNALSDIKANTGVTVNPWDAQQNIYGTAAYLSQQINAMGGSIFDGLRAYNQGVTGATKNPSAGSTYATNILNAATGDAPLQNDTLIPTTASNTGQGNGQSLSYIQQLQELINSYIQKFVAWIKSSAISLFIVVAALIAIFLAVKKMAGV